MSALAVVQNSRAYSYNEVTDVNNEIDFSSSLTFSPSFTEATETNANYTNVYTDATETNANYTNVYTDHGAVERALRIMERAIQEASQVSLASVTASRGIAAQALRTSEAQSREMRRVIEVSYREIREIFRLSEVQTLMAQRALWEVMASPEVPRATITQIARRTVKGFTDKLSSIQKAEKRAQKEKIKREREREVKRSAQVANIRSAQEAVNQLFFDFEKKLKRRVIAVLAIFPFFCYLCNRDYRYFLQGLGISFIIYLHWSRCCRSASILPERAPRTQRIADTYKGALKALESNPELTIREAVEQQPHEEVHLREIPNVVVTDVHQKSGLSPELERLVSTVARFVDNI